jgi:uncharacterized protein (DUF1330 family)
MISMIKIKDASKLRDYLARVQPVAAPFGAELVFNGPIVAPSESEPAHDMVVVVRFPDAEAIDRLYASDTYQPLVSLRDEAAQMTILKYHQSAPRP